MKNKVKKLESLILEISAEVGAEIPTINSGGCGVFAERIFSLIQKFGFKPKLRVYGGSHVRLGKVKKKLDSNSNSLRAWNRHGVFFNHIVVEWRGFIWDAQLGKKPKKELKSWRWCDMSKGTVDIETMRALVSTEEGWNTMFDRDREIPRLDQIIETIVGSS